MRLARFRLAAALLPLAATAGQVHAAPPGWGSGPVPGDWRTEAAGAYALAPWWWGMQAPSTAWFQAALAPYGQWRSLRGVGPVWVPRVGAGWRPYSLGGFVSDPRFGWRWVSAEPFGWAVFHYGRWGFDPRIGWFWVPGAAFAPHWAEIRFGVGWYGWTALPPPGWNRWGSRHFAYGGWDHPGWMFAPHAGLAGRIAPHPGWRPQPRELDRWRPPAPPPRSVATAPRPAPTIGGPESQMVEVFEAPAAPPYEPMLRRAPPGWRETRPAATTATTATRMPGGIPAMPVAPPLPSAVPAPAAVPATGASLPPSRPTMTPGMAERPATVVRAPATSTERRSERQRGLTPERMAEQEP